MSTMAGTPHTMPLTVELILLMVSSIYDTSFLYTIFYGICAGKGIKNAPAPALRHKDESEKRLRGTTLLRSALAGGSLMGAKETLPL